MKYVLLALRRFRLVACGPTAALTMAGLSCRGPECDSPGCTVGETLSVTGIPASGAPWSVSVCTDTSACATTTIDVYELRSSGNAGFTTGRPVNGSIDLTVTLTGAVVTEGRPVHLTVADVAGHTVTSLDHVVHLEPETLGGASCQVQCLGSHATKAL
jgi:hypothetical protein